MSEELDSISEVAKTTGKVVDAGREFGGFISRYISGSMKQAMGIFEDKLSYLRWENQVSLIKKAEAHLQKLGLTEPSRSLPLKIAIPLFQAASLEDDDSLQDLWAALLANGANASSGIELRRTYIDLLSSFTSLDAAIMKAIYSAAPSDHLHDGFWTRSLPDLIIPAMLLSKDESSDDPTEEVKLSLANLERLGLVRVDDAFYGGKLFSRAFETILGRDIFRACTLQGVEQ